jgi:hypothetical protein
MSKRRRPRATVAVGVPSLRLVYDRDRDGQARDDDGHTHSNAAPPTQLAHDTIRALEQLLRDARKGELVGIAYAALYSSHRHGCVRVTDDARENPTFTRGMVSALDDELRMVQQGYR